MCSLLALAADDVRSLLPSPTSPTGLSSRLPFQRKRQPCRNTNSRTPSRIDIDSDSTETGSETEQRPQPRKRLRRRRRMFIEGRLEIVEELETSEEEEEEDGDSDSDYGPKRRRGVRGTLQHAAPPPLINDTEPWWPLRAGPSQQLEGGRNRRQMELWEFILRSLDAGVTSTASAFQWVNRSVGVFRVTDTRKAAREWGRYRGNARMDYEKMARAMR